MIKEIVGFLASIIVIVSITFNPQSKKGNIWLRLLNLLGSIAFIIYGILLPAYATIFMNCVAGIINLIYLIKILRSAK